MKRYAVFSVMDYCPRGGMWDFVGAFETKEEAERFVRNSVEDPELRVEDMEHYLSKESPEIPSDEYVQSVLEEREKAYLAYKQVELEREERIKNGSIISADTVDENERKLNKRLQRSLLGDGT